MSRKGSMARPSCSGMGRPSTSSLARPSSSGMGRPPPGGRGRGGPCGQTCGGGRPPPGVAGRPPPGGSGRPPPGGAGRPPPGGAGRRPPGGASRAPSGAGRQPGPSGKTTILKDTTKAGVGEKETEFTLPAFSINAPKKKPVINWEKLKKDAARRQAPEGEDIKEIRRIMKELKEREVPITVHEFIALISPYTADNGACLRSVMAEDLTSFRKVARKVYETMTQDVSDVLVNEQLQMVQYYTEKHDHLTSKMMRAINDIYDMVPDFDFEKYLANRERYLNQVLPIPAEIERDQAEIEMQRRQAAYHRLQWLRSEGERMNEENKRLQRRLDELKQEQYMEQERAAEMAAEAEAKRQELMQQEAQVKDKLEHLNVSVEKSFVDNEANVTKAHNKLAEKKSTGAIKKTTTKRVRKPKKKPEWSSTTAADIEEGAKQEALADEVNKAPSTADRSSFRRPRRKSPHFSPIKTPPPREAPRERSPFHYSPPKAPQRQTSPFHFSPPKEAPCPRPQETKLEETATTLTQKRPPPRQGRGGMAPRDSWGGFY